MPKIVLLVFFFLSGTTWKVTSGAHTEKKTSAGETAHIFLFGKFLVGFLQCNCGQPCAGQLGCSSLHEEIVASFPSSVTDFSCGRKQRIEVDFGCSYSEVPWSRSGLYGLSLAVGQQPVPNPPGHERGGRGKSVWEELQNEVKKKRVPVTWRIWEVTSGCWVLVGKESPELQMGDQLLKLCRYRKNDAPIQIGEMPNCVLSATLNPLSHWIWTFWWWRLR